MKAFLRIFQAIFMLLFIAAGSASGETLYETVKKQVAFNSGGRLVLENVNGKVIIEGWNKNEFYMEADIRIRAKDREQAEEVRERVEIIFEDRRDEIYVRTRTPKRRGGDFWDWAFGDRVSVSVNYRINVPKRCLLDIENTNGAIEVADVRGEMKLETTNGKIWGEDIGGFVNANTTNGSIDMELTEIDPDEDMDFTTTNGSIKLYLPQDAAFDLKAKTTNGSVRTDFPLAVRGKYHRKRLEGRVNGGGARFFLETTNGSINVRER